MGRDEDGEDEDVTGFSMGDFAAFETDVPFMTDEVPRPSTPLPEKLGGLKGPQMVTIGAGETVLHTFKTDWVELSEAIPERHFEAANEQWVRVEAGLDDNGNAMLRFPDGLPPLYLAQFLFDIDDADSVARTRSVASGRDYVLFVPGSVEEPIVHGVSADGTAIALHVPDGIAHAIQHGQEAPHHPIPRSFLVYETRSILVDGTRNFGNPDLFVDGLDQR